jgi:hypothetical protein
MESNVGKELANYYSPNSAEKMNRYKLQAKPSWGVERFSFCGSF